MIRALMEKVGNMKQISNISREIRKSKGKSVGKVEIKNTITEIKNAFHGLFGRLSTALKESLSLVETSQIEI